MTGFAKRDLFDKFEFSSHSSVARIALTGDLLRSSRKTGSIAPLNSTYTLGFDAFKGTDLLINILVSQQ